MDPFLPLQSLMPALSLGAGSLLALAFGLMFYGYVANRVIFEAGGRPRTDELGPIDLLIAALLAALFALTVVDAIRSSGGAPDSPLPSAATIITGVVVSTLGLTVIVGGILGALSLRGIRWREVFGLDRLGPMAVVGCAVMLLAFALPLVTGCSILSRLLLAAASREDDSVQELVRFLASSGSQTARVVVGVSAVVAAPILEEFIFRGYLYGVLRRYAGVTVGILVNAALFAAIHTHLPSFGGLFMLAVCLTLAYEWTGSIFVPITMHAIFNAISVMSLLQGGANG